MRELVEGLHAELRLSGQLWFMLSPSLIHISMMSTQCLSIRYWCMYVARYGYKQMATVL
jgi:hypothetical protein